MPLPLRSLVLTVVELALVVRFLLAQAAAAAVVAVALEPQLGR